MLWCGGVYLQDLWYYIRIYKSDVKTHKENGTQVTIFNQLEAEVNIT